KGKAMDILKKLQMERIAHKPISQLSGGQKQKLFIGRALMQNADLFFFDEPFVGIDHTTQQQLVDLFKSMRKEGKTLVIVHHDLSTVESIFTHVIILNTYLVAKGGTQEVFNVENLKKAYGQSETILEKLLNTVSKEQ
ncbi:MAG: ATP-binding cassette domain-containing protein, partial [Simkaniaceae bacterium]|nr:ATP-binding cassette domain-containing protein [Simkaniaceae bacterium]